MNEKTVYFRELHTNMSVAHFDSMLYGSADLLGFALPRAEKNKKLSIFIEIVLSYD